MSGMFPGGDDPGFAHKLEPFVPADQSRGLARHDLARCSKRDRDAGSGHIVGCLIHDRRVIVAPSAASPVSTMTLAADACSTRRR
jgi:hypothetical protein